VPSDNLLLILDHAKLKVSPPPQIFLQVTTYPTNTHSRFKTRRCPLRAAPPLQIFPPSAVFLARPLYVLVRRSGVYGCDSTESGGLMCGKTTRKAHLFLLCYDRTRPTRRRTSGTQSRIVTSQESPSVCNARVEISMLFQRMYPGLCGTLWSPCPANSSALADFRLHARVLELLCSASGLSLLSRSLPELTMAS
jgi:hypothetical protein